MWQRYEVEYSVNPKYIFHVLERKGSLQWKIYIMKSFNNAVTHQWQCINELCFNR